ncbi:hypothetical protein [Actinopolymorpha pittospori]
MTTAITEPATAPHSTTLEALSRLTLLIREHRHEIPSESLAFSLSSYNRAITVQVSGWTSGLTPEQRRALIDRIAQICGAPTPEESTYEDTVFYGSRSRAWNIFTCDPLTEDGAP